MAADPVAMLKDLGRQFGKRVSSTNLFDANVCTSPRDPERPWEVLALPGDLFRHKLNMTFGGCKVVLRANSDFMVVEVTGSSDADVCSINRRDKVMSLLKRNRLRVPSFPSLPVYSRQLDTDLRKSLNSVTLTQALTALQLTKHESLHLYRNGLVLYLQRDSKDDIESAVRIACELTKKLAGEFPAVEDSVDLAALPRQFESLIGLIPKWALADDEQRREMLEEESLEALRTFVEVVSPYIPAIDRYLDSFGDESPTEAAVTLGTLAECCLEAQIRLRDAKEK